jgi:hypothetical protein
LYEIIQTHSSLSRSFRFVQNKEVDLPSITISSLGADDCVRLETLFAERSAAEEKKLTKPHSKYNKT